MPPSNSFKLLYMYTYVKSFDRAIQPNESHTYIDLKGADRIPNARDSIEFKLNSSNLSGFFLMKLSFLFYYIKAP